MNLEWAKKWIATFDGKQEGVDASLALYAEDFVFEDIMLGLRITDRAALRAFFLSMTDASPNFGTHAFPVLGYTGSAEGGAIELGWQGTFGGHFPEIPGTAAGKKVDLRGVTIHTYKNGKIATERTYWNAAAMFRQLGVLK